MDLFYSPFLSIMEGIWNIFLTIALVTPILIFLFGIINFICKEILIGIIVKIVFSLILHFIATTIVFLLLLFLTLGGDYAPSMVKESQNLLWLEFTWLMPPSLTLLGYACFDLFLFWFSKTELEQTLKMIERKTEKISFLFD